MNQASLKLVSVLALLGLAVSASSAPAEVSKAAPAAAANTPLQAAAATVAESYLQKFGTNQFTITTQPHGATMASLVVPAGKQSTEITYSLNCHFSLGLDTTYPIITILRAGNFAGTVYGPPLQSVGFNANASVAVSSGMGQTILVAQAGDLVMLQAYRENPAHNGFCGGALAAKLV